MKIVNIRAVLKQAQRKLERSGSPSARLDAEVLFCRTARLDRVDLYTKSRIAMEPGALEQFTGWIERRCKGEPVAYICGYKEFWSLPFEVSPQVLIPRPETEILVDEALKICRRSGKENFRILELGTGSGAVSVALASELKEAEITATDSAREALLVAKRNSERNGTGKIRFLLGNLYAPVSGKYDMILSNPPYIRDDEYDRLSAGIKNFEPREALISGPEGTEFHERIIRGAKDFLNPGGWVLLEIGQGQENRLKRVFAEAAYEDIAAVKDHSGNFRLVKARRVFGQDSNLGR